MFKIKRRSFIKSGSLLTGGLLTGTACAGTEQDTAEAQPGILDAIMNRRSVRLYQPTPVPAEHIRMILDAGRMAPTAGNQQPWKFIVTADPATIAHLKETCMANALERIQNMTDQTEEQREQQITQSQEYFDGAFSAPVYITILTDNQTTYPSYNHWDGPLAAMNIMIAARALGYGTVHYTDTVSAEVTKEVLNIPDRYDRVCFTPIGVPVEWPETPDKKEYDSFIVQNSF